ncbi:MAG: nucleotidyltransferase domain-containing protein [archaeon]
MIERSIKRKVVQTFFDEPTREFHLRELSRLLNISLPTAISTTDYLSKKEIIIKKKGKVTTLLKANREAEEFGRAKMVANLENIFESGVVDFLIQKYNHPKCIILFGSYARGEDIERSDIDIAILTDKPKETDLIKYQKVLKREISIHIVDVTTVSEEFRLNLMNGIVLEGSW